MFFKNPNMPDKKVTLAIADTRNTKILPKGIEYIPTVEMKSLSRAVRFHADLQVHHLGGKYIVSAPECYDYYRAKLSKYGMVVICGETALGSNYPGDVAYNIARIGSAAFHNTKYTDSIIKAYFAENGIRLVHINQGYSKCQAAVIDKNAIITSDVSLYKAVQKNNIEALLIEAGNISLPGYEYGFIGGCTFMTEPGNLFITGSIKNHPSKQNIYGFLEQKEIRLTEGGEDIPLDIGSVIALA